MGKKLVVFAVLMVILTGLSIIPVYSDTEVEVSSYHAGTSTVISDSYSVWATPTDSLHSYESDYRTVGRVERYPYTTYITICDRTYEISSDEDFAEGFKRVCRENSYQISQDLKEKWNKEQEAKRQEEEAQRREEREKGSSPTPNTKTAATIPDGDYTTSLSFHDRAHIAWMMKRMDDNRHDYNLCASQNRMIDYINCRSRCLEKGDGYFNQGKYDEALCQYEKADRLTGKMKYFLAQYEISSEPNANILIGIALCKMHKKEYRGAIQDLRRARENVEDNILWVPTVKRDPFWFFFIPMGEDPGTARIEWKKEKLFDVESLTTTIDYNLGLCYENCGDIQLAVESYTRYLQYDQEDNQWTRHAREYIKYIQEHPEEVKALIQKNQEKAKRKEIIKNSDSLNSQACDLIRNKKYQEAIEVLLPITEANPSYHHAWYNLGLCHERLGDTKSALECYKQYVELKKEDDECTRYTKWYIQKHQSEQRPKEAKAETDSWTQIEQKRSADEKNFKKGVAYLNQGRYQEALVYFRKVITGNNCWLYFDALYNAGLAYYQLGNYEQAIWCFKKVMGDLKSSYITSGEFWELVHKNLKEAQKKIK